MTTVELTSAHRPERVQHFWRCPGCGVGLIVVEQGKHLSFQRGGRIWKRCPSCRLPGLNRIYRAQRRGS